MKQAKSIIELATELEARKARKRDLVLDSRQVNVLTSGEGTEVLIPSGPEDGAPKIELAPQHTFMRQLGQHIGVRADLFDRLRTTYPVEFDGLVNGLLGKIHGERGKAQRHLIRTYTPEEDGGLGVARAFLGDGYRTIDNDDIAETVLPIIMDEIPGAQVEQCELTDTKMYIKVLVPSLQVNLRDLITGEHKMLPDTPDYVQAGFVITNSEVGAASFSIEHFLYRLVCLNGMIVGKAMSRRHTGKKAVAGEDFSVYSDETLRQDDKALMMKIGDVVRTTVNEEKFRAIAQQFADAASTEPIEAPLERMQVIAPKVGLTDGEGKSVLQRLMENGGDYSKFGLINAVTAAAQDVESYDRSVEMEQIGGQILDTSDAQWRELIAA